MQRRMIVSRLYTDLHMPGEIGRRPGKKRHRRFFPLPGSAVPVVSTDGP
jgi:hypothetical protein